eukprot:359549-Chlamydomonas_euryale.AAC.2
MQAPTCSPRSYARMGVCSCLDPQTVARARGADTTATARRRRMRVHARLRARLARKQRRMHATPTPPPQHATAGVRVRALVRRRQRVDDAGDGGDDAAGRSRRDALCVAVHGLLGRRRRFHRRGACAWSATGARGGGEADGRQGRNTCVCCGEGTRLASARSPRCCPRPALTPITSSWRAHRLPQVLSEVRLCARARRKQRRGNMYPPPLLL